MQESKPSNSTVDILKFAAAVLVMIVHTNPLDQTSHAANHLLVQGLGRLAVPFFFCISGYYFAKGLLRPGAVPRQYLRRNVTRLLMLYCGWSLVYFPFDMLEMRQKGIGMPSALHEYAGNFFLSGSHLQLWFLPALAVSMVLAFPFIARRKLAFLLPVSLALYAAGMFGDSWYGALRGVPLLRSGVDSYLAVFDTPRNGLFFGLLFVGMGARLALNPPEHSQAAYLGGFSVSLVFVFAEAVLVLLFQLARDFNMYVSIVPAAYFLCRWATCSSLSLSPSFSRYLRESSTGIYLAHGLFLSFFQQVLPLYGEVLSNSALCAAVVLPTVAAVTVLHVLRSSSRPCLS